MPNRKIAISDIHGCVKTFAALLAQLNFAKTDELFLLGDYVDRGPNSKGVIDYIWLLQDQGHTVHCLMGNHEEMVWEEYGNSRKYPDYEPEVDKPLLQSFGASNILDIPERYIDWMRGLPRYVEISGYILVHAGINFDLEDPLSDEHDLIWIRDWYRNLNRSWLGDRVIVHGHTPQVRGVVESHLAGLEHRPVICIDGGCVFPRSAYSRLCALDLTNRALFFQDCLD